MISSLFVFLGFFMRSLFVINHNHKKNKKNVKQVGEGISLLKYIL